MRSKENTRIDASAPPCPKWRNGGAKHPLPAGAGHSATDTPHISSHGGQNSIYSTKQGKQHGEMTRKITSHILKQISHSLFMCEPPHVRSDPLDVAAIGVVPNAYPHKSCRCRNCHWPANVPEYLWMPIEHRHDIAMGINSSPAQFANQLIYPCFASSVDTWSIFGGQLSWHRI